MMCGGSVAMARALLAVIALVLLAVAAVVEFEPAVLTRVRLATCVNASMPAEVAAGVECLPTLFANVLSSRAHVCLRLQCAIDCRWKQHRG